MYSRNHAVLSGLLGIPLVGIAPAMEPTALLWVYVVVLGVGIDLDHFVIARMNRGDWDNLLCCLRDPSRVFVNQASIFDSGEVWRDQRLLSHLLIGGCLTAVFWAIHVYWAFATALTIYVHLLADLSADVRTRDEYLRCGTDRE